MFQGDYILRQVEMVGRGVAKILELEEFSPEIGDHYLNEAVDELNNRLMKLLADGNINEAENLLFETIENNEGSHNNDYFQLAFDFYLKVKQYDDDYLRLCNFSKEEADDGWRDIMERLRF